MAAASGSVLALAAWLRALDDDALAHLVEERGVRPAGVTDFFDLAEALLERSSVQAALQRLDRPTLALLGSAAETSGATVHDLSARGGLAPDEVADRIAVAEALGLVASDAGRHSPWDVVAEQLRSWPTFGLPGLADLIEAPPPDPGPIGDPIAADRIAADRAFAVVDGVAELLLALRDQPARRIGRGSIALPDARRVALAAGIEPDEVEELTELAALAGLAVADGAAWTVGSVARTWSAAPRPDRWVALAAAWRDALPADLRSILQTRPEWHEGLRRHLDWLYPGGADAVSAGATRAVRAAERLGISVSGVPSRLGLALLTRGTDAAAGILEGLLPTDVERVYLQHDLTVIAPGPLRSDLAVRLRGLADPENRGVASTFRITALTLDRALLAGETAEGIRDFLARISLTGIPQPLDYLLGETAQRFGILRVGEVADDEDGARSYVRSDDAELLGRLAVDQVLAPLALVRPGPHRLLSRFDAEVVQATLREARYPAVIEDADGRLTRARPLARSGAGATDEPTAGAEVVARLRTTAAGRPDDTTRAWLSRQLELAVKGRLTVRVTVRLPGGPTELVLEPTAIASGRVRARDSRAGIERTLPLSSIDAVEPAQPAD
jgi:hypothetical protein